MYHHARRLTLVALLIVAAIEVTPAAGKALESRATGCILTLRPGPLLSREPLFLRPGGSLDVFGYLDADASGKVSLAAGEKVLVACPGSKVGGLREEVLAECDSGTDFIVDGAKKSLTALNCDKHPTHSDVATGKKCGYNNRGTHAVIGHSTSSGFVGIIEVCFLESRLESLWASATIRGHADGAESGVDRPTFIGGNLFPNNVNPDYQYMRATQQVTFEKLLGSQQLALNYIHNTNDYFLARGHFAAKADFVWAQPQRATFYFSNAAPQWQTFNGGNWERMEASVRHMATSRNADLFVVTGAWGQATLPDVNGNPAKLSLLEDGRIPVPALYWRVVYQNATGLGVAFVGVNNPYTTLAENPSLVICKDICSKISWVDWDTTSVKAGEGYCCEVDDLRSAVPDMPPLSVKGILV